jgi:glycosyltransferase involved in cell wall biosynthesis
VLSEDEARLFPANWGIPPERVHVTPFHWVLDERELDSDPGANGGIFAGGDSLRDYGPLFEAADGLAAPVTIASRTPPPRRLPENVVLGPVDPKRYDELLRAASVVVVPLEARHDRSAGQQNYLNAMALGKPVVVTDALGVRDYVEDRRTGLIVPPGDPRALRAALEWVLDPANAAEVGALGERARAAALERFGPERYVRSLLAVVDQALGGGQEPLGGEQ